MKENQIGMLWTLGISASVLMILIGIRWEVKQYTWVESKNPDIVLKARENLENQLLADALNSGKVKYDPSMNKIIVPTPFIQVFFGDLLRVLLLPIIPLLLILNLIRYTTRLKRYSRHL